MGYNLFLDDNWTPPEIANLSKISVKDDTRYRTYEWLIVKTYDEFISIIKEKGLPDIVSFDHDLHPEHYDIINEEIDYDIFVNKTGYHAAEWLMEYCANRGLDMPICLVHSQNIIGNRSIKNLLF